MGIAGSLIAGATYALFTSESKANIAVTSGTVDVEASISDLRAYTPKKIALDGTIVENDNLASEVTANEEWTLGNGGSVKLNGSTLTLSKMTPGDWVRFNLNVTNYSNVAAKYRTVIQTISDEGLFDGLSIIIDETTWSNGFSAVSPYADLDPVEEATVEDTLDVTVYFPADRDNTYQNTGCEIQIIVEAIQGNAATDDYVDGALYLYNERDLKKFANAVNNNTGLQDDYDTFILANNVTLVDKWTPIGQKNGNKFTETFDGANYTVSNMIVDSDIIGRDSDAIGTNNNFDGFGAFFGCIQGGTVKNLTVNGTVTADNAAGIASRVNGGTIENCVSNVTVTGGIKAGGIVCAANSATTKIVNCVNKGNVNAVVDPDQMKEGKKETKASVGGIVGYSNTCEIEDCVNTGTIGSLDSQYVGGIVGYATKNNTSVVNSTNTGDVYGKIAVAGIIGLVLDNSTATITNCSNSGHIYSSGTQKYDICCINGNAVVTYDGTPVSAVAGIGDIDE